MHPPSKADASYHISSRAPHLCVHQTGSRGDAETRRRGERKRSAHKAGWTGLHPFPEAGASRGTACPDRGSTYLRTAIIRYAGLAVGLMEIENIIRYTERAVGLKPSARQGEACLRGLYRSISSKTIRPRLSKAKPACAGSTGLCIQRPYALGYARRSPPARARADYLFEDHQPAGGARRDDGTLQPGKGSTYLRTAIIRHAPCAVGLMEIENIIRYAPLAVGLMEIEN